MSNPAQTVATVVVIGIVLLIGLAVSGAVVDVISDSPSAQSAGGDFEPVGGETTTFEAALGEGQSVETVTATREYAVAVDGDGFVDADPPDGWDDGSWSVTAVATANESSDRFNPNATHVILAADNGTLLVTYDAGKWAAYYDDGALTQQVSVNGTLNQTEIVVVRDADNGTLAIDADGRRDVQSLDSDTEQRNVTLEWVGTIDEVRYLSVALDDAAIDTYQDDPINPLNASDHTARWMFDEGEGSTSEVYYGGSNATLERNATWAAGVDGPELVDGADYELETDPIRVTTISGGYLDGAPVAYVSYTGELAGSVRTVIGGIAGAYELAPVVLLVLVASVVIATISRARVQ